jgi:UDP-glucose 4-epimerase
MTMLTHAYARPVDPARVLILGAKGFVASQLHRLLREERLACRAVGSEEVNLIDSSAPKMLEQILRPDDAVVMTSTLTPDKGRDLLTLKKNLRMAESLCAALTETKCAHVVYISSDAVYDARSPLVNEEASCEPVDLYALMHIAREKMLAQTCRSVGIPLAILRPCAVYGSADTHNSYGPNRFIRSARTQGKITLFGEGEEQRDHLFINDLMQVVKLCLTHRSTGILNVVSGRSTSFKNVAICVNSIMGGTVQMECLSRSGPISHRHFDNTALLKGFPGFQPTPLNIGIGQTIAALTGGAS